MRTFARAVAPAQLVAVSTRIVPSRPLRAGAHRGGRRHRCGCRPPSPASSFPEVFLWALQGQPHHLEPGQAVLSRPRLRSAPASRGWWRPVLAHRSMIRRLRHSRRASGRPVQPEVPCRPLPSRPAVPVEGVMILQSRGDDSGHLQDAGERHGRHERGDTALAIEPARRASRCPAEDSPRSGGGRSPRESKAPRGTTFALR